jgi:hypothetical protein
VVALLLLAGCAGRRADLEYRAGGSGAAIDAYEEYLAERGELLPGDARRVLRLALAYADRGSPRHDLERAGHYWQLLVDVFPRTPEARQARLLIDAFAAQDRVAELEAELARRDQQLSRVNAVLQSVVRAETRLRTEVESKDEARADLEGRVAALTRQARRLSEELVDLQGELAALKRIDLEGVAEEATEPP